MLALGLVVSPGIVLAIPGSLLVGYAFGAAGLAVTTYLRDFSDFQLIQLVMLPMFLFATTFYPLSVYPGWARPAGRDPAAVPEHPAAAGAGARHLPLGPRWSPCSTWSPSARSRSHSPRGGSLGKLLAVRAAASARRLQESVIELRRGSQACGRRQTGRGQRGHRQPRPEWSPRDLGGDARRRAHGARRDRLRAPDPPARAPRPHGRADRARAPEPGLPGARRGGGRRARPARLQRRALHAHGAARRRPSTSRCCSSARSRG